MRTRLGTMVVMRASIVAVSLALLVSAQHIEEEQRQFLETSFGTKTLPDDAELINVTQKLKPNPENAGKGLREFNDHAELKEQQKGTPLVQEDNMMYTDQGEDAGSDPEITATTEVPEPLPTPMPVKTEAGTDEDVIPGSTVDDLSTDNKKPGSPRKESATKKSSVVGKKGVGNEKPSVVPKKGVIDGGPSVQPRKGADPDTVTPSVFARKGVVSEDQKYSTSADPRSPPLSLNNEKFVNTEKSNTTVESASTNIEKNYQNVKVNLNGKELDRKQGESLLSKTVFPISKQSNNSVLMSNSTTKVSNITSQPVLLNESAKTISTTNSDSLEQLTNKVHSKPTAATDDTAGAATDSDDINYGAVLLGLVLFVALAVTVVVGYQKLQDIWMRRHYAHVNFLVDGMYDV